MKKNFKYILIIIFIVSGVIALVVGSGIDKLKHQHYAPYEEIISKIDDKENFDVYITNYSENENSFDKVLNYYSKNYKTNFITVNVRECPNSLYNEILSLSGLNNRKDVVLPLLVHFKNGKFYSSVNNIYDEDALKNYLLNNNTLSSNYKNRDYILNDVELDDFINSKNVKILFYTVNDKNVYEYRKKMLDSGYNYSIIYTERNNNTEIEAKIKEMIKLPKTEDPKLPMLIKIKEGKVLEKIERVTLDNVVDGLKKLNR